MIEEQIDPEILVSDFERHVTADEREAGAQLEEELLDVGDARQLDLLFAARSAVPRTSNR